MGYYSNYFIKALIRRIINILINKRTLKILLFSFIILLILSKIFNSTVYGASIIDDTTYYDGYSANIEDMQMLQNDFIIRLEGLGENHSAKVDFMDRIKSGGYALFIYYGDGQGGDYLNSRPILKKNVISVFLMPINNLVTLEQGVTQNWGTNGEISCARYTSSATYYEYKFTGADFVFNTLPARTAGHWYPTYLFNYKSDLLTDYIISYFQGDTSKVINAINNNSNNIIDNQNQNTNTIVDNQNQNTNTIVDNQKENTDKIINTITDTNVDNDSFSSWVDSSASDDILNNSQFLTSENIIETVWNNFKLALSPNTRSSVVTVDFPLPYVNKSFTLQSDMISRYINGTPIRPLITAFWTFIFGWHIATLTTRIVFYFASGDVLQEGGLSRFRKILHTELNNISPFKM